MNSLAPGRWGCNLKLVIFKLISRIDTLIARFMGPIWGRQDPGGSHVGPMNFAIRVSSARPVKMPACRSHKTPLMTTMRPCMSKPKSCVNKCWQLARIHILDMPHLVNSFPTDMSMTSISLGTSYQTENFLEILFDSLYMIKHQHNGPIPIDDWHTLGHR